MNTYKRSPILRGDILYAELGAAVGSEQAGFRPVVVVQNDVGNRYSPTVVVAPLTSNIRKNILPTHVYVGRESGVRPSLVLLEQLRTVDKCRLGDKIGHVNKSVMYSTHENVAYSMKKVPIWEKYALSLSEAAEYFHIGTRRLRQIIAKDKYAKYLIWNGGRVFFKRKMFEEYLNNEVQLFSNNNTES